MLFGARTTRNERRGGIIPNPSQHLGREGGVAVLEGGSQPNGEEGRYNTQPIPNIRLSRRGCSVKRVKSLPETPLVSGPSCDIGHATRAQGTGTYGDGTAGHGSVRGGPQWYCPPATAPEPAVPAQNKQKTFLFCCCCRCGTISAVVGMPYCYTAVTAVVPCRSGGSAYQISAPHWGQ
jgi:hypothetical protein